MNPKQLQNGIEASQRNLYLCERLAALGGFLAPAVGLLCLQEGLDVADTERQHTSS